MAEGVVVADENGQFILFNQAAERIAGVGRVQSGPGEWAERYGIYLTDGVTPMPADEVPLIRAVRGEASDAIDMYLDNKEVSEGRWLNVSARPLRTGDGTHLGGVVVFRDVTERHQNVEKLKEYAGQPRPSLGDCSRSRKKNGGTWPGNCTMKWARRLPG